MQNGLKWIQLVGGYCLKLKDIAIVYLVLHKYEGLDKGKNIYVITLCINIWAFVLI